jgi:hypothetical protein
MAYFYDDEEQVEECMCSNKHRWSIAGIWSYGSFISDHGSSVTGFTCPMCCCEGELLEY